MICVDRDMEKKSDKGTSRGAQNEEEYVADAVVQNIPHLTAWCWDMHLLSKLQEL